MAVLPALSVRSDQSVILSRTAPSRPYPTIIRAGVWKTAVDPARDWIQREQHRVGLKIDGRNDSWNSALWPERMPADFLCPRAKAYRNITFCESDESAVEVIQVVDPRHPLYGRYFRVIRRSTHHGGSSAPAYESNIVM